MSRSVWVILILGFLTVIVLVIAMLGALRQFGDSPHSNATKLALAIKGEFHFESTVTATRNEGMRGFLVIHYETHADSKFNQELQIGEMQKVAQFAAGKFDASDKRNIDEIQVRRTEVHGRGCFQQSYVATTSVPNPHRAGPPPSPFRPQ